MGERRMSRIAAVTIPDRTSKTPNTYAPRAALSHRAGGGRGGAPQATPALAPPPLTRGVRGGKSAPRGPAGWGGGRGGRRWKEEAGGAARGGGGGVWRVVNKTRVSEGRG